MSSPAWSTSVTRERAIGNIESYVQAVYAYDVRTEIVGSKGSVFVGSLYQTPAIFLSTSGETRSLAEHFLTRFADAYLAEMRDFVDNMLHDRPRGFPERRSASAGNCSRCRELAHAAATLCGEVGGKGSRTRRG
jgi:predicted dehydrogenase